MDPRTPILLPPESLLRVLYPWFHVGSSGLDASRVVMSRLISTADAYRRPVNIQMRPSLIWPQFGFSKRAKSGENVILWLRLLVQNAWLQLHCFLPGFGFTNHFRMHVIVWPGFPKSHRSHYGAPLEVVLKRTLQANLSFCVIGGFELSRNS